MSKNEIIEISKENAFAAHKGGNKEQKQFLEMLLGKKTFLPEDITERIKSYEDACEEQGLDPNELPWTNPKNDLQRKENADHKLNVIGDALRQIWKADFSNSDNKYYAYFEKKSSGSGLSFIDVHSTRTFTCVGARRSFPTYKLAEYYGKQFIDLHTESLTL